jgi:glucan 1,3-beta-glucosidase
MSVREGKMMALAGLDFTSTPSEDLQDLFRQILDQGMHGLCFSLYEEGQKPGDVITEEQVRKRMKIIRPHTKWVRSFSSTDGNELVPMIAKEYGLKTLVGAWLGKDPEINKREINGLIQLAGEGYVDIAAVGNEVMYREDLTEDELLNYISHAKALIPEGIPVGYVDAYYEFAARPRITEMVDVILANCYPFWEGCAFDYSLIYMKNMYSQALKAGLGKKVIITETGWPSQGKSIRDAHPSGINARNYFINTQLWSKSEDIDIFYFSSFDESWKVGAEGDVGAFWGIWDKNENLKF